MTEKEVTAFYDKDIKWIDGGTIRVGGVNPVLVRLKSESVGLKWLEKYCADTRTKVWKDGTKAFIDVDDLLSAVRAKAKEVKK